MAARKAAAFYAIIVGALMVAMWLTFLVTGQIPELETRPWAIAFHLAGEFLTAILLVAGGYGLYSRRSWGYSLFLVAMGMLLYTGVVSPGYYAQSGDLAFVAMFAVLTLLTLAFIAIAIRRERGFRSQR